jgi:hypothetical protein
VQPDKFALLRNGTDAPAGGWTYLLYCTTRRPGEPLERHLLGDYRQFHSGLMLDLYDRVLGMATVGLSISYDEEASAVVAQGEWRGAPIEFRLTIVAEKSFSCD